MVEFELLMASADCPSLHLMNAFLREVQQGTLPTDTAAFQALHSPHSQRSASPPSLEAFLTTSNKHGDTVLLVAAREGHVSLLQALHEQYGLPLNSTNSDGKTALHEAAQNGRSSCMEYLLRQGAVVDALKRADWWV